MEIKPIKKITLTDQIMNQIASLITNGHLKENEKLPNERELAQKLGVTRSRVRESLRALSLIGLVTIKPGEGTFVNENEKPIPEETITWMFYNEINNLSEIYDVRKLLETEIYMLAAKKITKDDKYILRTMVEKLKEIFINNPQNYNMYQDILDDFDLKMADWSGNKIYVKLMQQVIYLRRAHMVKVLNVPGALQNSYKSRLSLLEALDKNDYKFLNNTLIEIYKNTEHFYKDI